MIASLSPILDRQRRKRRSASVFRWLVVGLLLTALPLGILAWADSAWVLSKPWRWCALVLWLVGCLWMLASALRAFRVTGTRDVAALLDQHAGRHGGYAISTATELTAAPTDRPEEAALLARLHSEAASLAAATTLAHPNPRKWQIAAACLAVGLVGAANPLALRRLFQPSRDLPYTTLSLAGPTTQVEAHQPFTVSGVIRGRVPSTATLQMTGGAEISLPITADGSYRYTFEQGVGAPVKLVTRAGADGVSSPLTVALREPLRPTGYGHHIQPPAYTRRPEQIETRAAFSILRGSTGRYGVTFNRETRDVRMVFDTDQPPLDLVPDDHRPLTWTAKLPELRRTAGYHLEAVEPDGNRRALGEPGQIVVLPDKPPTVEITAHNEAQLKSPHDTFALSFRASDDIGLTDVRVRYQRVGESEWQESSFPLPSPDAPGLGADWKLPLDELHAQPHDLVTVVLQARDNNTLDGPGVGASEPILIEIPDDPSAKSRQGDGDGGADEMVNPLATERWIYGDTLRASLGRKAPAVAELSRRQEANVQNLADMIEDAAAHGQPEEYIELLKAAQDAATQASVGLQFAAAQGDYEGILALQGAAIDSLVKASRMGGSGGGSGHPQKAFSLTTGGAPKEPEDKEKDQVEQVLADLKKLLQQQSDINQQLGEKPPDGTGESKQDGQAQSGQMPDGESPGSQTPGSEGQSSGSLGQQQGRAGEASGKIAQQLQSLGRSKNGGDPAQAVEQMKLAEKQQALAAEAIAKSSGAALLSGEAAAASLRKAEQLTASLLGQTLGEATAPQNGAPAYQTLIQQYSRRLSYDQ